MNFTFKTEFTNLCNMLRNQFLTLKWVKKTPLNSETYGENKIANYMRKWAQINVD